MARYRDDWSEVPESERDFWRNTPRIIDATPPRRSSGWWWFAKALMGFWLFLFTIVAFWIGGNILYIILTTK